MDLIALNLNKIQLNPLIASLLLTILWKSFSDFSWRFAGICPGHDIFKQICSKGGSRFNLVSYHVHETKETLGITIEFTFFRITLGHEHCRRGMGRRETFETRLSVFLQLSTSRITSASRASYSIKLSALSFHTPPPQKKIKPCHF